jgi:hypothetical protein
VAFATRSTRRPAATDVEVAADDGRSSRRIAVGGHEYGGVAMGMKGFWDPPTLDDKARHPGWHFFGEDRLTDGRVNTFLAIGVLLIGLAAVGLVHWVWACIGALMLFQLWRNWRRYRQRLFFALAERDRERDGIIPPTHPDARDQ